MAIKQRRGHGKTEKKKEPLWVCREKIIPQQRIERCFTAAKKKKKERPVKNHRVEQKTKKRVP